MVGSSRISSDRPGQQFHRHRRAFALPAGQLVDAGVGVLGQLQLFEHLGDDLGAVGFGGVWRQSQFGGVAQRLIHGELAVHDVVLGDHADAGAQRRVLGVDVVSLECDSPGRRVGVAGRPDFAKVDLPAPDGPITAVSVPGRAEIETLSSSFLSPSTVKVMP